MLDHETVVHDVAPGVKRFTVPLAFPSPDHLNVHLLDTPDGPLLVDTGARGSEEALHSGLAQAGPLPSRVLITHGHVDHWGLAFALTDRVLAHPGAWPSMRYASGHRDRLDESPSWLDAGEMEHAFGGVASLLAGLPDIEPLADGDRIGDWQVLWTPGHDAGHVCLHRDSDGLLVCGDLLLPGFTPNIQPNWDGGDALAQFQSSLLRMRDLDISLVLPAHGEPYVDSRGRIDELLDHHERRLATLREGLEAGPRTLSDLRSVAFGGASRTSPADAMLAQLETFAHLDHLRLGGEIQHLSDGRWALVA